MVTQPKIGMVEHFLFSSLVITSEILGALSLGTVGVLITGFITMCITFYLKLKGLRMNRFIVGSLIDLIPFVNALPTQIIVWEMTVWMANHPKAAVLTGAGKGNVGSPKMSRMPLPT